MNKSKTDSHHNQRQRKKLRLGEFQELGFEVAARLAATLTDGDRDALVDDFLEQAIEANGLLFGGGLNDDFGGFIVSGRYRGSATEADREAVRAWLAAQPALAGIEVGALRDAWHHWR